MRHQDRGRLAGPDGLAGTGCGSTGGSKAMLDLDRFVADCREAFAVGPSHKEVREVVACAVSDPAALVAGLGEPRRAEVQRLYCSEDLTILNVVWGPRMTIMPHNHLCGR